jgi:hypothetical protein
MCVILSVKLEIAVVILICRKAGARFSVIVNIANRSSPLVCPFGSDFSDRYCNCMSWLLNLGSKRTSI